MGEISPRYLVDKCVIITYPGSDREEMCFSIIIQILEHGSTLMAVIFWAMEITTDLSMCIESITKLLDLCSGLIQLLSLYCLLQILEFADKTR